MYTLRVSCVTLANHLSDKALRVEPSSRPGTYPLPSEVPSYLPPTWPLGFQTPPPTSHRTAGSQGRHSPSVPTLRASCVGLHCQLQGLGAVSGLDSAPHGSLNSCVFLPLALPRSHSALGYQFAAGSNGENHDENCESRRRAPRNSKGTDDESACAMTIYGPARHLRTNGLRKCTHCCDCCDRQNRTCHLSC